MFGIFQSVSLSFTCFVEFKTTGEESKLDNEKDLEMVMKRKIGQVAKPLG